MSGVEMLLVKQANDLTSAEVETWKSLTLRLIDGMNAQHKARWRRFVAWALRAGEGEYLTWTMLRQRSTPAHRRHFALEQSAFDAQERLEEFEVFRTYMKIAAGHVQWAAGGPGMPAVVPIPKSISYAAMGEDEFQEFHASFVRALRNDRVTRFLWPHLKTGAARSQMVESILDEFHE